MKHVFWPQCYETTNQSQEEQWKTCKDRKAKIHVIKQWMAQQWDQGRNQKITWNKWQWGHNNPKCVGHWEAVLRRKFMALKAISKIKKKLK